MANGRNGTKGRKDAGRDAGGFVALPWTVLDSPAFTRLAYPARALLLEIARQFVGDNNGRLLVSGRYLAERGWNSNGVITKAKRELIEAGFIHETVKGHRPNKASWYAVTWYVLDRLPGFDPGAAASFERGAYRRDNRSHGDGLTPAPGAKAAVIAPSHGAVVSSPAPSAGAMKGRKAVSATPARGDHLDKPSAGESSKEFQGA